MTAAEAELEAALRLDPRVPGAYFLKGQILESQDRLEEAAQAYREELSAFPKSLAVALALSRLEGRRGRPAEQEQVLRDAIRANPNSPGPYRVLASIFLQRQERYAEAVELAELALRQNPKGQELHMAYILLADLHYRIGDSERAAEYARLAEQLAASGGGKR